MPVVPSEEQAAVVEAARCGESVRVLAFAGTGKTTALELVAEALQGRRVLYLVFNKAQATIARERLERFPSVRAMTAHGLAFSRFGNAFAGRIATSDAALEQQWTAFMTARGAFAGLSDERRKRTARAVVETARRFMASADARIEVAHVPADPETDREAIAALARRLWASLREYDELPVSHDWYLKAFGLERPALGFDAILFDEAQDATPAMLAVVERQAATQRIFCGDRHQQLYEFRGAVDALGAIALRALPLTVTRRFGGEIARAANAVLAAKGEPLRIASRAAEPGRLALGAAARPDVVLARTNAGLVEEALAAIDRGATIFLRGGTGRDGKAQNGVYEILGGMRAAHALYDGRRSDDPQFAAFEDWAELQRVSREDGGERYAPYVRLVERYAAGTPAVLRRLRAESAAQEREADVVLSTVHRFKGEEAATVSLAADFRPFVAKDARAPGTPGAASPAGAPREVVSIDSAEANVAYVALTRPSRELWYGGAYEALDGSLRRAGGAGLPVTPAAPQPVRESLVTRAMAIARAPERAAVRPARAYRKLEPGSRWRHAHYGVVTVEDAGPDLVTIVTGRGERKRLGTLGAYDGLEPANGDAAADASESTA